MERTIYYRDNGDAYLGAWDNKPLKFWKEVGKTNKDKYLYKGYRYYDGKKDTVVVFTKHKWTKEEISRRKNNGFLGIREYKI